MQRPISAIGPLRSRLSTKRIGSWYFQIMTKDVSFTELEIAERRDAALRRALTTPPKPTKEMVGKTERAQEQRELKDRRKVRAKSKDA